MRSRWSFLILAVVLVLVIAAAYFGYSLLKEQIAPQQFADLTESSAPEQESSAAPNPPNSPEPLAPDFTVYDREGNPVSLSDFRGKPVILNFWATWCGYCKEEMPDFEAAWEQYGDKVAFLMIQLTNGSDTKEKGIAYIDQNGYGFPVYFDQDQEAALAYSIFSLPTTIAVDAQGHVIGSAQGRISRETVFALADRLSRMDTAANALHRS